MRRRHPHQWIAGVNIVWMEEWIDNVFSYFIHAEDYEPYNFLKKIMWPIIWKKKIMSRCTAEVPILKKIQIYQL